MLAGVELGDTDGVEVAAEVGVEAATVLGVEVATGLGNEGISEGGAGVGVATTTLAGSVMSIIL